MIEFLFSESLQNVRAILISIPLKYTYEFLVHYLFVNPSVDHPPNLIIYVFGTLLKVLPDCRNLFEQRWTRIVIESKRVSPTREKSLLVIGFSEPRL